MALFLAAMQNISSDFYDAAKIDGAGRWGEFMYVSAFKIKLTRPIRMVIWIWLFLKIM